MIVVFDSSVLVPLILDASHSTALFRRLISAGHLIVASPALFDEVARKLRTKASLRRWLNLPDDQIERFLADLATLLVFVPGALAIPGAVPDDPDDDVVIAAAVESQADFIVTEDRHLLNLGVWQAIRILDRATFARELDKLGVPDLPYFGGRGT